MRHGYAKFGYATYGYAIGYAKHGYATYLCHIQGAQGVKIMKKNI